MWGRMTTGVPPAFDGVSSFDEFAARLSALRARAGLPSYTTLAARVAHARAARGVPAGEATPGRITVYECFRPGRRRMDVQLVADLVRAMGVASSIRGCVSPFAGRR